MGYQTLCHSWLCGPTSYMVIKTGRCNICQSCRTYWQIIWNWCNAISLAISWVWLMKGFKSAGARCIDRWWLLVGWWCTLNVTVVSRWLVRWTVQVNWNTSAAAWKCSFPRWLILCHVSVVSLLCAVLWFLSAVDNDFIILLFVSAVRVWRLEAQLFIGSSPPVESRVEPLVKVRGKAVSVYLTADSREICTVL